MDVTIKKPAVIEPSQMPRMNRTAKSAPKDLHDAWQQSATDHTKMFKLIITIKVAVINMNTSSTNTT